jgi:hypothetical protein
MILSEIQPVRHVTPQNYITDQNDRDPGSAQSLPHITGTPSVFRGLQQIEMEIVPLRHSTSPFDLLFEFLFKSCFEIRMSHKWMRGFFLT